MVDIESWRARLRRPGVWTSTDGMTADEAAEFARWIEELGYSTLWVPEVVGRDPFVSLAHLAANTTSLLLATGVASIFNRAAGPMKQAATTVAEISGGRFVHGMGVSHRPFVTKWRKVEYPPPLAAMRAYLTELDAAPYSAPVAPVPRLLGAMGPKMLALSAELADGAMPYFGTPEHTARARAALGEGKLLCVEQKVVVSDDPEQARRIAVHAVDLYARTPNYRNNWLRLGFSEEEIEARAPEFVDAVVVSGDAARVLDRVTEHYAAGADHVCVQPLSARGWGHPDREALAALARVSADRSPWPPLRAGREATW